MSFSAPKAPDPAQTAAQQQQYNIGAAKQQNANNSYGQSSAYGSINYVPDSSQPSGYRIENSFSPTQQGLYNTATGTQAIAGQTGQDLLQNTRSMYSQPFNGNNQAVTDKLNQWQAQYLAPIFKQQGSNLEAQLHEQGLTPGSEAYNNAKNLLARNQGDVTTNYLTKNQQQGFDQALTEYQTPLQTIGGLFGMAAPQGINPLATPSSSVQPANYAGLVQSNYENQLKNYENTWNNIGKLGTSAASLAFAPMTGGTSLAGMFGGWAGNQVGKALGPSGGYTGWTSGGWG